MDEAPGGREQREFTVDARSSPSNDEKGWACALQKLTFRTGQIVQTGETAKRSKKKRRAKRSPGRFLLHVKLSARHENGGRMRCLQKGRRLLKDLRKTLPSLAGFRRQLASPWAQRGGS
jgi:hypothetical protein